MTRTSCPVIRTEPVSFGRLVGIDDFLNEDYIVVRFSREIVWVRQSTTLTEVLLDGEDILDASSHHDYYGFLMSLRDPLDYAREYTRRKKIGPDDMREVRTTVSIIETPYLRAPARLTAGSYVYEGNTTYLSIPKGWYLDDDALARRAALWSEPHPRSEDHIERNFSDDVKLSELESISVADVVIFSSKNSDAQNVAAIQRLKEFVPAGLTATLEGIDVYAETDISA